jgi:hypothetical protein
MNLPVTEHLKKNPEAPVGFERAGKSVVERWNPDHPEAEGGQGLTEVCKCRSEYWADQVVKALNELKARETPK